MGGAGAPTTAPGSGGSDGPASFDADSKVILEGYLMKLKQTSHWVQHYKWNKRWFQIRDGFLLYFKRRGQRQPAGWLRVGQIRSLRALDPSQVLPGTNRSGDNCFQIALTSRTLLLRARSREEAHSWMKALTGAIEAVTPGKGKLTGSGASGIKKGASAGNPSGTPDGSTAPTPTPYVTMPPTPAPSGPPPAAGSARSTRSGVGVPATAPPMSPGKWSGDPTTEWVEYWDAETQNPYYVNTRTNESAWVIPGAAAAPHATDLAARDAAADAARAIAEAEASALAADAAAAAALKAEEEAAAKARAANAARDAAVSAARAAEAEAKLELDAAAERAAEEAKATEAEAAAADAQGWIKCFDYDFDCEYFYNTATGEATYERPTALPATARYSEPPAEAAAPGAAPEAEGKEAAGLETAGWTDYWTARDAESEAKGGGEMAEGKGGKEEEEEAELFTECWDATYQLPYYVSSITGESTWDRPADEDAIVPYHEDTEHEWQEAGVEGVGQEAGGAGTAKALDFETPGPTWA